MRLERAYLRRYTGMDGAHVSEDLMRLALASIANTAIVPMQDILDQPRP